MTLAAVRASLAPAPLIAGLVSPFFYACAALGFLGVLFPSPPWPRAAGSCLWLLATPFVEEFTWRALLQAEIAAFLRSTSLLSPANIIASAAFATAHILVAPSVLAALTFFPSLVFGALWTKFRSTWLCGLLHLWYNLCLRL